MDWLRSLFGGWKQVRHLGGYSYQVSRRGARRIVKEPGFSHYGDRDEQWLQTGHWSEEEMKGHFKRQGYIETARKFAV